MGAKTARHGHIQLLSDLHLEVGQQYASFAAFPQTAPYLLLAGDVGRLADYQGYAGFLAAQAARYERVLLVLGNHEFWGLRYEAALDAAQRLCAEPALRGRVELLHRARWDCPRTRTSVLGCTLWSRIPRAEFDAVTAKVKDFRRIEGWTPEEHVRRHEEDLAWLRDEVKRVSSGEEEEEEEEGRQLLVATHHAPSLEGTSRPRDAGNPWSVAFASSVLEQEGGGGWDAVRVWAFGHTHYCTNFERLGVRVVANQRGYVLPDSEAAKKEIDVWEEKAKPEEGGFDPRMTICLD
ncbi:hypothetical protein PWT90_07778 [Aphanocladium album]|nr:hypothetical protein PWT90_07778 [Aphanocladium album]